MTKLPFAVRSEMSRRSVLKALGAGIVVLATGPVACAQQGSRGGGAQTPQSIDAWLHIGGDGQITVLTGKVEVGQNVRTSLAQAVAEELRVPIDSIRMVMGDTDLVPYDMGTFGSRTTPTMAPQLRRAGAAAREALLDLAAEKWGVDRSRLRAEGGRVTGGTAARTATYGELVAGMKFDKLIRSDIPLTPPAERKVLGASTPKVGARAIVTGSHRYSADLVRPDMLHAVVLRAPSLGAQIDSIDEAAARSLEGVQLVRDGEFAAVAAPTRRQAERALAALGAKWREIPGPSASDLFEGFRKSLTPPGAPSGNLVRATYTAPYIAHVPLEPRAALAEWDGQKMTVHTGTQRPFGVRSEVAQAIGLPEERVRVLVPDTGSGYGGKHSGEAAVEAARIARALGKPVRVAWRREEEFRFAYLRPAALIEVTAGVGADGGLTFWSFESVNPGGAGLRSPYRVADPHERSLNGPSPLRQGSYRALGATVNNFARESQMDDLARLAGLDPVAFRLKNLDDPRLKAVLETCASRFGWGAAAPSGHGFGIACGAEKGGFVATAAEVAVDGKEFRVVRATTVFECGAVVNPKHLENQVLGCLIQGLGGALFERIDYRNGRLRTDRLTRYRVPRFGDVPPIEVVLFDRPDLPSSGAGECPIIAIAPAIRNALLAATGQPLRDLPLQLA